MDSLQWMLGRSTLGITDLLVLTLLLALMIGIGYWVGGGQSSTEDFFLARRGIPWWAACLSFVATEVSAVTIISVPATVFKENWEYAQFFIGSFAARAAIAYVFIPAFYHFNCTTIYEFLKHRFGAATQYTATIFFFITRLLGSGVRLMAASMAVAVLLGWPIFPAILIFTVISMAYIMYGGIESVVWTGVLQASVFIVAGLATVGYLLSHIHGGWHGIWAASQASHHLQVFNWGPAWNESNYLSKFLRDPNIIWIAILNGFFGSLAAFGTDQELMQRLLTVETRRKSQKTMVLTPFASFFVLCIYMTIGTCLFAFYQQNPTLALPSKLDEIFPHFIAHGMPPLLRGLLLSAIVMASIDSPLASLTASFVTDIYRPLVRPNAPESHYLRLSRVSVAVFALLLAGIAYAFSFFQDILWLAFKIGGVTFGSLLGVFLLGLLTERKSNRANVLAMISLAVLNATILTLSELKVLQIGWTWLVLIGTAGTFGIAYALGPRMERKTAPAN